MPQSPATPTEEACAVIKAIDDVLAISDPEKRAKALCEVLRVMPLKSSQMSTQRRADVTAMLDQPGATLRSVGALLNVNFSTVQDIVSGYRGSGRNRRRKDNGDT